MLGKIGGIAKVLLWSKYSRRLWWLLLALLAFAVMGIIAFWLNIRVDTFSGIYNWASHSRYYLFLFRCGLLMLLYFSWQKLDLNKKIPFKKEVVVAVLLVFDMVFILQLPFRGF